jgi:CDP-diacylglycerol--glycerol-3-phosphate 3-phosphatidyltransferase
MANWITISRFPLLVGYILMVYLGGPWVRLVSVPILFILMMLDTVDGMVARARGQTSLIGSVLDIAADRTYELVLWVMLTDLGLIPVAIPLIVIIRTTLTDAVRSIGVGRGMRPFDQLDSPVGRFLVGSSWMRSSYSVAKIATFCGLMLGLALQSFPSGSSLHAAAPPFLRIFAVLAWVAAALCVLRGIPVILGAIRYLRGDPRPSGPGLA